MYLQLINLSHFVRCEVFEQCELPSYDGYVLTKYYRETCPHCQRLAPLIKEIDDRLERHGIDFNVRSVECGKCDCSKDMIDAVPTVVLTKDNEELGRFKGYREYEYLVDFIHKHMGVAKKVLTSRVKNIAGKVVKLKQNDFYSAFEGPWIILFYDRKDDIKRELIKEIADVYSDKVMVGEVSEDESKKIENMYNISEYPTILGSYNGLLVQYQGDDTLPGLIEFTDQLINPTLEEINLEKFNEIAKETKKGDPLFIVFYTSLHMANAYFKSIAHEFKYKAKFYKTNDKELFDLANIHPTTYNEGEEENTVLLASYRNEVFYRFPHHVSKTDQLYSWIFYAHYPHVSKVDNSNFQALFFGVKPLIILLTTDNKLVDKFEKLSIERHMGLPFSSEIFAMFDMNEFNVFGKYFFGEHKVPGLIIYNPYTKKLHGDNRPLTEDNFYLEAHRMLRNHDTGKLRIYNAVKGHKLRYLTSFVVLSIALSAGFSYFNSRKLKFIKAE